MRTPGRALLVVIVLSWIAVSRNAQGAVAIVNNTHDSGSGSLRDTVLAASAGDTIEFNIPTSDPGYDVVSGIFTITLTSGEIVTQTDLTIANLSGTKIAISGNHTSRIVHVTAGTLTIIDLSFVNGNAQGAPGVGQGSPGPGLGGAILNEGSLVCTRCTFANNSAAGGNAAVVYCSQTPVRGGEGKGGAIANQGTLSLVACTLAGNSARGGIGGPRSCGITGYWERGGNGLGGAIFNGDGVASLFNCTITGNTATSGWPTGPGVENKGGGLANVGNITLNHCTLVDNLTVTGDSGSNATSSGGGLFCDVDSTTVLRDVILARNVAMASGADSVISGPDASGSVTSEGHNLLGRSDGCAGFISEDLQGGTTDETKLDPMLGPLSSEGGSTQTLPLLPGSPAIDAGSVDDSSKDQRYFERSGLPDIGAFEYQGTQPVRLANISTRVLVRSGDNAMIGGFIVTGTSKTVVVRGIGPSLPSGDALANPIIEVHGPTGAILAANDDWRTGPSSQEILGTGLPPTHDLESAWWGQIDPGAYSVIVRGQNDASGIALFEVYDVDQTADSKLANVSTRGAVGTGDNVMIGGTIIVGTSPRVLFRALGPTLAGLGVPEALENPTLELYDSNGQLLAMNDNWRDQQEGDIIATGIPPSDDLESAIVEDFAPGSYTAVVRGNNNATGVALIEIYDLN